MFYTQPDDAQDTVLIYLETLREITKDELEELQDEFTELAA